MTIFVDTAGWGNLLDVSQPYHPLAATIYRSERQRRSPVLTTNYVLLELVALLDSPLRIPRLQIVEMINSIKASPHITILHIGADLDRQSWELLANRQDKHWSLVDCSSFVVMHDHGIQDALTTDHHFSQAGFTVLLKS